MAISLNTVNSEVVRAHKRIDSLSTAASSGFPNFGAAVAQTIGTTYTAPTNGFILVGNGWTDWRRIFHIDINGRRMYSWGCDLAVAMTKHVYPVAKGNSYRVYNETGGGNSMWWVPSY